jgi:hypothetical protein
MVSIILNKIFPNDIVSIIIKESKIKYYTDLLNNELFTNKNYIININCKINYYDNIINHKIYINAYVNEENILNYIKKLNKLYNNKIPNNLKYIIRLYIYIFNDINRN